MSGGCGVTQERERLQGTSPILEKFVSSPLTYIYTYICSNSLRSLSLSFLHLHQCSFSIGGDHQRLFKHHYKHHQDADTASAAPTPERESRGRGEEHTHAHIYIYICMYIIMGHCCQFWSSEESMSFLFKSSLQ